MSIPADRLREIADGAMGIGAPLVLTQAEQVEVCTELLALRDATSLPGYTRLVEERDAARAEAEKLRDEVTQLEGMERQRDEAYATLDDVCKALGADVDSAVAQALMFKEKAGELAAVKRQRDELLEAAKLAIREIRSSTDCSMCHDSTWDHECDSKVNTTHVALLNAIKGALAAEQPKPQQPEAPIEPRPWWVVFGLERWEATRLHALHPSEIERRLGGMVDIAGKRQIHPTEIARALDGARAELLTKPQQPEGGA